MSVLDHHHKLTLQRLQKLHRGTPDCVVFLLAGSLPASALLHLRMLGLLGMVARLGPTQILHRHATHTLLSCTPTKSWFELVRSICSLYSLPDPLLVLQNPSTKFAWKNLCKSRVIDWWEQHLRGQAALLPSLQLFKSAFMSLTTPHPIWTTANSPYEISKAVVSARMLSGRYRTDYLSRHWSKRNPSGHCTLPGCDE